MKIQGICTIAHVRLIGITILTLVPYVGIAADLLNLDQQFIEAAKRGDEKLAKTLLDKGADINARGADGRSAIIWAAASDPTAAPKKLSTYKEIALPGSTWKSIVNETFRFSFQVPASSKIIRHNLDTSHEYFRVQNYEFDDSLDPFKVSNRYWLEIFVYDRKADTSAWKSCPRQILEPIIEASQHVNVYRGDCRVRGDEGESDRERCCLCAETDAIGIWVQGAESNNLKSILDKIYKSFRFRPEEKR